MILRSVLASRTRATASDATSGGDVACETQRGRLDLAPHGALGGFAQATAALVASAPTSSSGVGRLGDGGCSDIGRRSEAVCVEEGILFGVRVGRDVRSAGSLRGLGWCRGLRGFTRRPRSARGCSRRARDTGEAQLSGRDWWAALDGQARDQSRLSEGDGATRDRDGAGAAPRSTLRSGAGERDRERALEAVVVAAARGKAVAASWPDSSLRDVEDAAGGAVVAAEAARKPAAVPAPPRTVGMPTATESTSSASTVSWAASRRRSSPRDRSHKKRGRGHQQKRAKLR